MHAATLAQLSLGLDDDDASLSNEDRSDKPAAAAHKSKSPQIQVPAKGRAWMNNQILRSGAFSGPILETVLPVIADKRSYALEMRGVSPRADHMDALLFALSLVRGATDPVHGATVWFSSHQFLSTMRWAINRSGYDRLARIMQDLKRIELRYLDESDPKNGRIHVDNLFARLVMPTKGSESQLWEVGLPATLFRLYGLKRNAQIDLKARAVIRSEFGRWLHGFISTQEPGKERVYDAEALCRGGGLNSARLADDLKQLRATVEMLETGELVYRGQRLVFTPVISPGAVVRREPVSGRFTLTAARCPIQHQDRQLLAAEPA